MEFWLNGITHDGKSRAEQAKEGVALGFC
jgi:hypothetical protein